MTDFIVVHYVSLIEVYSGQTMKIFDRLFGGRFNQPPPDETRLSDAAIMRELHPHRSGLKHFTYALLAHMPEKERARLVRRVMRCYGQGEDKGQTLEHLALFAIDWKGFDGFEYLAPYLIKASGVQQTYVYQDDDTNAMAQTLAGLDQWLAGFGKRYLHLDTGADEYVGCIVEADQVDSMIALAQHAGLKAGLVAF
jgi:hypothetical protein